MSQPSPASTDENSSTSLKNARTASAFLVKMIAWAPVIMLSRRIVARPDPGPAACLERRFGVALTAATAWRAGPHDAAASSTPRIHNSFNPNRSYGGHH